MRVLRSLVRLAGVFVRYRRMLLALLMIAFAVVFRGGPVSLGCIVVVFGGFIMSVFGHDVLLGTECC